MPTNDVKRSGGICPSLRDLSTSSLCSVGRDDGWRSVIVRTDVRYSLYQYDSYSPRGYRFNREKTKILMNMRVLSQVPAFAFVTLLFMTLMDILKLAFIL